MFGWHELVTNDAAKAAKFYSELFGWKGSAKKGKDGIYMIMTQGSQQVCGIKEMPEEFDDAPPHWLIYFNVKDCDKAMGKVEELGGSVFHKPLSIPSIGQYTVVRDPAGAVVALLAPAGKKSTAAKAKKTKSAGTKKKAAKKAKS
jgi:hypothetical protein